MKKLIKKIVVVVIAVLSVLSTLTFVGCKDDAKTIKVCASDIPHAEVLNGVVKGLLAKKGYTLEVTILDWNIQNDSVANGDYDANYFQHVPYLETYTGSVELFASCKVHYEPLGIYVGKATTNTWQTSKAGSYEICDDVSNAIRAFQLLEAKGVISKSTEDDNYPVNEAETEFTFSGSKWESKDKSVSVTLVAENLLVASMGDYDYACLPCNSAYTGKVTSDKQVAKEDDPVQVALKANVIAARLNDYLNNEEYTLKIDALTDAMLSQEVSDYFATKYLGAMTCDSSSQIDLRNFNKVDG